MLAIGNDWFGVGETRMPRTRGSVDSVFFDIFTQRLAPILLAGGPFLLGTITQWCEPPQPDSAGSC